MMPKVEYELRNLMDKYNERHVKLSNELKECKDNGEDTSTCDCLIKQHRIMSAELFKTMKNLGVLDAEEIEYGGMKTQEAALERYKEK